MNPFTSPFWVAYYLLGAAWATWMTRELHSTPEDTEHPTLQRYMGWRRRVPYLYDGVLWVAMACYWPYFAVVERLATRRASRA